MGLQELRTEHTKRKDLLKAYWTPVNQDQFREFYTSVQNPQMNEVASEGFSAILQETELKAKSAAQASYMDTLRVARDRSVIFFDRLQALKAAALLVAASDSGAMFPYTKEA